MNIFTKIFPVSKNKQTKHNNNEISIYLDAECKRSIEVSAQTVENYLKRSQFEPDQFVYLVIKHKKTQQVFLKRKLSDFQNFGDVLSEVQEMGSIEKDKSDFGQYRGYIIMGYNTERNMVPRISSLGIFNENLKFIRSGYLQKYSDIKNNFQECQLKLHHDYLTYFQLKPKQKKVSFLPLENATVEMINEKKHIFTVKDKFKSIMFKTSSREDMIGWLIAINQAIRVRNAQIYMNQLDDKLSRKIKDKLASFQNRCNTIRSSNRTILLDDMGRKCLREYFKKNQSNDSIIDIKLLTVIQTYLYMCKVRRQKGEGESQGIIESIKSTLIEVKEQFPDFSGRDFNSRQEIVKAIEQIMKYLDEKYRKILIDKKYLHSTFQGHLANQYKQKSRIPVQSLFGQQIKN